MAQITVCDRCGSDGEIELAHLRGVPVDLCKSCADELFDHDWLREVLAQVGSVPTAPRGPRDSRRERSPRHGFTAKAIEASQDPTLATSDG